MSNKQGKKRKASGILNYEEVKANVARKNDYLCDVREKLQALKSVDLNRLMADRCSLTEDEALHLLACKISFAGVYNLRTALGHVPENITRVLTGIPLRATFILNIFKNMSDPESECGINIGVDDLLLYIQFLEMYCASFLGKEESDDYLWQLTETEEFNYNKFLTPPFSSCTQCERKLTIRNNPSKAKLYTLNGPVPCTKITLECRECCLVYGLCNYTSKEGTHLYPDELKIGYIEISNVTYIDIKLYKWFPPLRLV